MKLRVFFFVLFCVFFCLPLCQAQSGKTFRFQILTAGAFDPPDFFVREQEESGKVRFVPVASYRESRGRFDVLPLPSNGILTLYTKSGDSSPAEFDKAMEIKLDPQNTDSLLVLYLDENQKQQHKLLTEVDSHKAGQVRVVNLTKLPVALQIDGKIHQIGNGEDLVLPGIFKPNQVFHYQAAWKLSNQEIYGGSKKSLSFPVNNMRATILLSWTTKTTGDDEQKVEQILVPRDYRLYDVIESN